MSQVSSVLLGFVVFGALATPADAATCWYVVHGHKTSGPCPNTLVAPENVIANEITKDQLAPLSEQVPEGARLLIEPKNGKYQLVYSLKDSTQREDILNTIEKIAK